MNVCSQPSDVARRPPVLEIRMAGLGDQDRAEPPGALAELELVEPLEVERERAAGAVDLEPEQVLAARGEPGRLERAERTAGELDGCREGVIDVDLGAVANRGERAQRTGHARRCRRPDSERGRSRARRGRRARRNPRPTCRAATDWRPTDRPASPGGRRRGSAGSRRARRRRSGRGASRIAERSDS